MEVLVQVAEVPHRSSQLAQAQSKGGHSLYLWERKNRGSSRVVYQTGRRVVAMHLGAVLAGYLSTSRRASRASEMQMKLYAAASSVFFLFYHKSIVA